MASTTKIIAALSALASTSSAHLILANPVPYSQGSLNNSPLESTNYPCQVLGNAAKFYSTKGISNTVVAGGSITLSFKGSIVHDGGSCQIALSTDMQPSVSTRWSVILSIEGGCPTKNGTSPSTYNIKIPESVSPGRYSFAWTWISKMSAVQEYYMNCAPIIVTSSKKSQSKSLANEAGHHDDFAMTESKKDIMERAATLDSIGPPLGVFNLAKINSCKSTLSSTSIYPYPGSNVESFGSTYNMNEVKILGSNCFAKGVKYSGSTISSAGHTSDGGGASSPSSKAASAASSTIASDSDKFRVLYDQIWLQFGIGLWLWLWLQFYN